MSDVLRENPVTLLSYETFVTTERKAEDPMGDQEWITRRILLLNNEAKEFLNQHGPGGILLAPSRYAEKFHGFIVPHPEIVSDMADELSDLLWYSFDIATHVQWDIGDLSSALKSHIGSELQLPSTFREVQDNVMSHASEIKFAYSSNDGSDRKRTVSLSESPLQAFAISHLRLTTALEAASSKPLTEMLESNEDKIEFYMALGDYINVLTYIAKDRLGIDIENIARYNVFKLRHRKEFGKSLGNLFFEFNQEHSVQDRS